MSLISIPIKGRDQCCASLHSNIHEYLISWSHDAGKAWHREDYFTHTNNYYMCLCWSPHYSAWFLGFFSKCIKTLLHVHSFDPYIIHISHGFEGDIPEYQPRGDTKALARYVTQHWRQRVTYAPGLLCHHEANILIGIYAWKDMWCMLCSIIKQEAHGPHPSPEKPFQIKCIIMLIRRRKNPKLLSEKWIVLINFVKPWVPFT